MKEVTETHLWRLHTAVNEVCKLSIDSGLCSKLQKFLSKQIWTQTDRQAILTLFTEIFMNGSCVHDLTVCLGPLILDVVSQLKHSILNGNLKGNFKMKQFAVALSDGLSVSRELRHFALDFVKIYKPLTSCGTDSLGEPKSKKAKRDQVSDLDWCRALFNYMTYVPEASDKLDMCSLLDHLSHSDTLTRWYAASAISKYFGMSEQETCCFLKKYFTQEEQRSMFLRVNNCLLDASQKARTLQGLVQVERCSRQSHTKHDLIEEDLHASVVNVMGILLPSCQQPQPDTGQTKSKGILDQLVIVPSTSQHLRSLALAVTCGEPVLLQGPVGCGKTCLVEHLAAMAGHKLVKIQLGDQTDSKALLGTYCSTEVPGEFVWRAGVLTQAVASGQWVLLEDVDTAPMDVLSLLVGLAETGALTGAGGGSEAYVQAASDFQLFTTQRFLSSSEGVHKERIGNSSVLEKYCSVIYVEPLSRAELVQVITTKFPVLGPVAEKLLDIYFMLSAGKHDTSTEGVISEGSSLGKFYSTSGRLISTRDLMTWCSRSSVNFDHTESSQGQKVFLEAVDCFVTNLSKTSVRLKLAASIGCKLNIPEDRSRYFLSEFKPNLRESPTCLEIGRATVQRKKQISPGLSKHPAPTFSYTRSTLVLLEKVAICVQRNEPVLLSGETGTGKTFTVQYLAHYLGHKLHVINLNQQSDSSDLLGGFKPVDMKFLVMPLREEFEILFCQTFSRTQNEKFLSHIQTLFSKKRWKDLLLLMEAPVKNALKKFHSESEEFTAWSKISKRIGELRQKIQDSENVLAFSFIEGTLVKALRSGDWVLLDEINLASADMLECLSGLLESPSGSVVLTERGDAQPVKRNSEFRLFACMNPATDVGKKDLPVGIRNRFTEFYVEEMECPKDLATLVRDYLPGLSLSSRQISGIVNFYLTIKSDQSEKLMDGTGHKPHFSLRTLSRALRYCARNPCKSVPRSLYEGFCMSFLTAIDRSSHPVVEGLILKHVLVTSSTKAVLGQKLPQPEQGHHIDVAGYWVAMGELRPEVPEHYIVTPSVKRNLRDLARVVSAGKHPVLLQGETSVGKTSLILYLAQLTGNKCVRVNNHEHTDLQEYIGCYAADASGRLVFKEGVLVEAMRKGHWIILDELNLAPTDVLEALNRLLDDNQELYIPENQQMVQAHPKFMLFATQNPPGLYGGRKILSRAFRNRFVELHFDEIPPSELETILHERCGIPLSYARKLVAVMLELQTRRRGSSIFFGKQGFMTLRDLFRWAQRYNCPEAGKAEKFYDWDQHLAEHGYMLLAGRVRKQEEETTILSVIQKHLKRTLHPEALFTVGPHTPQPLANMLDSITRTEIGEFHHIVWTYNMRRLAVLVGQAIRFREPILLVGDTGIGKTTVCQLYAMLKAKELHCVNCHMHTESADFLGGLRPVRSHEDQESGGDQKLFEWKDGPLVQAMRDGAMFLIDEISLADDSVLERLNSVLESDRMLLLAERVGGGEGDSEGEVEKLEATEGFQVFATMNPGGDFGKKELSPALRNRFTEIWCPKSGDRTDLESIIEKNIRSDVHLLNTQDGTSGFGKAMMDFIGWFTTTDVGKGSTVSIRDILSWVNFINICCQVKDSSNTPSPMEVDEDSTTKLGQTGLPPAVAFVHGACLVFIDSLGAGPGTYNQEGLSQTRRQTCLDFLCNQFVNVLGYKLDLEQCGLALHHAKSRQIPVVLDETRLTIHPFSIEREPIPDSSSEKFALEAPTTCENAQRLLRGMQLPRPILLEGSPGVGKTSLVAAVARLARKTLVRINLSEQTDISDLFGADLPVEGEEGGRFTWRDGPFLQALKAGHWVVFDELNLASQSVLEGLNACFDHRAEVYIPELGKTFAINHTKVRIFACQNPLSQGGGRKGLPQSFLNRFSQVYVEPLGREDLIFISCSMYPDLPQEMLTSMVDFNSKLHEETMVKKLWGSKGSPWEFNLRDLFRWCDLLYVNQTQETLNPGEYVGLIYKDRMRSALDKTKVEEIYAAGMGKNWPLYQTSRRVFRGQSIVQAGHSFLTRGSDIQVSTKGHNEPDLLLLHHYLESLESLIKCVEMGWLAILVGPQSCGKTSLVRLLAQLTGQPLSILPMNSTMDTTELLGGFEQCDIWRHVKSVAGQLEVAVRAAQRHCLVYTEPRHRTHATSLEKDWSEYLDLSSSVEGLAHHEVLTLLGAHIQQLQTVLLHLQKMATFDSVKLGKIEAQLSSLKVSVDNMKPGAGGGAFEWVDSELVNALKSGHWLLVDNVNFCSASVLDRLNALLEPNGVLTINERGTVDGRIPTIAPHPDFRLFFAMDPKYGEVSRAMRNRGIEIYMLGEDEGQPFSKRDVFSMLKNCSRLTDNALCDWLFSLHEDLKAYTSVGDRPVLSDLLQAGSMTASLLEHGIGRTEAVSHATDDVYVSRRRNAASKRDTKALVSNHLLRLPPGGSSADTDWMSLTRLWPEDTDQLTMVKEEGKLLLTLVKEIQSSQARHDPLLWATRLQTAALIYASVQSERSWQLSLDWLESLHAPLSRIIKEGVTGTAAISVPGAADCRMDVDTTDHGRTEDKSELALQGYESARTLTAGCLKLVFHGDIWPRLKSSLAAAFGSSKQASSLITGQAWDLNQNPLATKRARVELKTELYIAANEQRVEAALSEAGKLIQRLQLSLRAYTVAKSLKEKVELLEKMRSKSTKRRSSSVQLHPALGVISLLLSQLSDHLPNLVSSLEDTAAVHLAELPHHLLWLPRLADLSATWPDTHREVFHAHLALHWQWTESKLGQVLAAGHSNNPKLHMAIEEMRRHLALHGDGQTAKLFARAWTQHGHPQPYLSPREADLSSDLSKLFAALTPRQTDSPQTVVKKVKLLASTSAGSYSIQQQIWEVARLMRQGDLDAVERALQCLLLRKNSLLQSSDLSGEVTPHALDGDVAAPVEQPLCLSVDWDAATQRPSQIVALWPLYEQMAIMAHIWLFTVAWPKSSNSATDFRNYEDDAIDGPDQVNLRNFVLWHSPDLFDAALQADNDPWKQELHLLRKLWNSAACQNTQRWLEWSPHAQEFALAKDSVGPALLHQASLSRFCVGVLCSHHLEQLPSSNTAVAGSATQLPSLLPLHLTLAGIQNQMCQVGLLSRHTWSHAAVLGSSVFHASMLEKKWLSKSVHKLCQLLQALLLDQDRQRQTKILKHDTQASEHDNTQATGVVEITQMIQNSRDLLSSAETTTALPDGLLALVSRCFEVTQEALESTSDTHVGRGFVYVGLVLAKLLAPQGLVDPVEKAAIKLTHVHRESQEVAAELATWNLYLEMHTSRGTEDTQTEHLHPRVIYLLQRKEKLSETSKKLKLRQAYRPDKLQFSRLVQATAGFLDTTSASSRVTDMVSKLMNATTMTSSKRKKDEPGPAQGLCLSVLQEERVWQDTSARFLDKLLDTFPSFQDILTPFVIAVYQIKLGLRLMAARFERDVKIQKMKAPAHALSSLVDQLCTFPSLNQHTPDLLRLADNLASSAALDLVTAAVTDGSQREQSSTNAASIAKSRLLSCALLYLKAHSASSSRLEPPLVSSLRFVLAQFASGWQEQEERRRQREAEEGALFKYKEKIHGDDRSEKEKEEADFRSSYPSFEKDFIDITGADRLEDVGQGLTESTSVDSHDTPGLEGVTASEMDLVCYVHHIVFTNLSQADWLEGTEEGVASTQQSRHCSIKNDSEESAATSDISHSRNKDLLTSALMAYQVGAEIVKSYYDVFSTDTDSQILGSHVVVSTSILRHIELQQDLTQAQQSQSSISSSYNIYYDENVTEVLRCRHVLASLAARVAQLQQEWADHPTLLLLNQIMNRILSFSVLNPLVKYLTGLELLLQKAQDWESNAASFVSLSSQLAEITSVIVEWRRLELNCWRNSLNREEQKCQVKASHWWFHLHQLTTSFLHSEEEDRDSTTGILTALKTFMESSTLGEFSVRLRMLFAFHCQLLHANKCPAQESLLYMLWNVYQFYKQYQPSVEAEIKRLRLPIEKQLKGFVKIARWSDMNYWALKDSTEKTHRAVHKRVKEYQVVLSQPAKSMLGDSVDDLVVLAVKQTSGFPLEQNLTAFSGSIVKGLAQTKMKEPERLPEIADVIKDFDLLKRAPKLLKKMKVHLRKCLIKSEQSKKILAFDNFTVELIQEMHDLHGLQVDMSADKEKQKSEARSIDLRKRKGLSELFKYLTLIGLSYRKGLTGSALLALSEALDMPPLNLTPHRQLAAAKLWSGCESYFYRCISRYAQFAVAIGNPSKELGMADIQRCRGFVTHLGHLYLRQKARLTDLVNQYLALRKLLSSLATLGEVCTDSIPPQTQSKKWLECAKTLTTRLSEGLGQFELLLDSCPRSSAQASDVYPSPFQPERLAPAALWSHGDNQWLQCMRKIQILSQTVQQEKAKLDALLEKSILGRSDMKSVSTVLDVYESFVPTLASVIAQFSVQSDNSSKDKDNPSSQLVASLSYLSSEISQTRHRFHQWWDRDSVLPGAEVKGNNALSQGDSGQVQAKHADTRDSRSLNVSHMSVEGIERSSKILSSVESLVEMLLVSVQTVVQAERAVEHDEADQRQEDDNDEEDELSEAHLSEHLLEREKKIVTNLNCSKIVGALSNLIEKISSLSESGDTVTTSRDVSGEVLHSSVRSQVLSSCVQALLYCQPLVTAFTALVESQVGLSVAVHRSMGKLLSVLLATFTELAQKGFCVPPDLSDEMEGEGATEFQDIEGGGIGEGEGAKDVSDQIETEDQLEEAKRPDQQEQPEDSKEQPDIAAEDNAIEMSEDFEGKLHDQDQTEKGDEDDEDDDKEEDEDMEKEMGEADGEQDKLDDRLWGSDDDDEEADDDDNKNSKEEDGGGGMDKQMEESVAKDDNKDAAEPNSKDAEEEQQKDRKEEDQPSSKDAEEEQQKDRKEEDQPKECPEDDDDYDDNKVDAHNQEEKEKEAENLELPEDMTLDDGEKKGQDEEDMEVEDQENPAEEKGQEEEEDSEGEGQQKDDKTVEDDKNQEKEEVEASGTKAEEEKENEEDGDRTDGTSGQEEEKLLGELEQEEDKAKPKPQDQIDAVDDKTSGDATQQAQQAEEEERAEGGLEQEEPAMPNQEQDHDQSGVGAASSEDPDGNFGQNSNQTSETPSLQREKKRQRKPGETDDQRTLGSRDEEHRRLKTREQDKREEQQDMDDDEMAEAQEEEQKNISEEYQHVTDPKSHWDAQTVDVATQEQTQETQAVPAQDEGGELDNQEEDAAMEDEEELTNAPHVEDKRPLKSKSIESNETKTTEKDYQKNLETERLDVDGERVLTYTVERKPESTIHTVLENLHLDPALLDGDVEEMRSELEQSVTVWSHPGEEMADLAKAASEAWQKYQAITCSLSQELCEQLRLILEPSQATKLKGDYRTGKRLNMRKVIPYIASQFRKDKIWLRRSKPSKRQYQIMIAIDDSASMADNHSKQLAFESLALVSNALTLLESGDLAVCSFGEDVRVLHPFFEPFTQQSGANILQHLTCEQKQTKYGQLLDTALGLMQQAQVRSSASIGGREQPAQLLLVLSDGHGVFREGMDIVRRAVKRARQARIFLVFLILDSPDKKGSLLDARVPIMEPSGKIQEIKSYMELFPFPFYIFLRDINSMPQILSDALRQWFELVTASDR